MEILGTDIVTGHLFGATDSPMQIEAFTFWHGYPQPDKDIGGQGVVVAQVEFTFVPF